MKSFAPEYLRSLVIPNHLFSVIRQLGEHKGRQALYLKQAPEILENLRQVAVIQSTESSNRLEGITADPKRIRALVEEKTTPRNRSESEIAGYRDVLNTVHQNHAQIPFTPNIVLQLHRDLMKYAGKEGGRWKSTPNQISETLPDGTRRIRFEPVPPHQTADFMERLHAAYEESRLAQQWDPVLLTAFYVLDFLCIHPFLDGNGRTARLLTVLLLYRHQYEVGRYISLERIVEQTRESYYDTLYQSSQGWHEGAHNPWPWTEYFLGILLAAYQEFESRFERVASSPGNKTQMILKAIDGFFGEFRLSDVEAACPTVSRDMIRHVLFKLRDDQKIMPVGKGRNAKWQKMVEKVS
jgi:Fic family protein